MFKDIKNTQEYKNRPYTIVPYDPTWPDRFEVMAKEIKSVFLDDALQIEHIGSTSVPGMDGKPIIDILLIVKDVKIADAYAEQMAQLGYEYAGQYLEEESRLFRKMSDGAIISNVQVFPEVSQGAENILVFREYLRNHPEEVKNYTELKKHLSATYPDDYSQYRKLKGKYMDELEKRAFSTPR